MSVERGDAPAPLVITGVHEHAWRRSIRGTGEVFGIRLRPAGLAVLSALTPESVADATIPVTADLDARLHETMTAIAASSTPQELATTADQVITEALIRCPPTTSGLLANDVVDELRSRIHRRTGTSLAQRLGRSDRSIQRALARTIGRGPKWTARRIRLQEVALALVGRPEVDVATIAVELGYTDQSHLISDFRTVSGLTPDAYRREVEGMRAR